MPDYGPWGMPTPGGAPGGSPRPPTPPPWSQRVTAQIQALRGQQYAGGAGPGSPGANAVNKDASLHGGIGAGAYFDQPAAAYGANPQQGRMGNFYSSPTGAAPGLSGPRPAGQWTQPNSIMNAFAGGGFSPPPGWRPAQVANQQAQTVTPYSSVQSTPTGHDPWGRW